MAILDNADFINGGTGFAESGTSTVSEGGNSTIVTGTFTPNAWDTTANGTGVSDFGTAFITAPISAVWDFSNPVEDLNFTLEHVSSSGSTYDDEFTVAIYDENGDLIPAATIIAALTGVVNATVYEDADGFVVVEADNDIEENIGFDLTGFKVSQVDIVFDVGPDGTQTGGAGISDFTFTVPEPDYIILGDDTANLIDANYVDDIDGDRIDNNDYSDGSNDDSIIAGNGDDTIIAGAGDDTIHGDAGNDSIEGGSGNDSIFGGSSYDTISGGIGDDTVSGGDGQDQVDLGDGNDLFVEGSSQNNAFGNDTVEGGAGNDTILADGGADSLSGGAGSDSIQGGANNDTIDGGTSADTLEGGDGDDTFILNDGYGNDSIVGGEGGEVNGDHIDASAVTTGLTVDLTGGVGNGTISDGTSTATYSEIEELTLTDLNDTVTDSGLGQGDFVINLGGGNDTVDLTGPGGDETIYGGTGNDTIISGASGADLVYGEEGNDRIAGDSLFGGIGDDTLYGVYTEVADGGDGTDTFQTTSNASNMTIDLSTTAAQEVRSGQFTEFNDIENVYTGYGDDNITGDAEANNLRSIGGDNTIDGGAGDDTLTTGAGADTLDGGAGNDTIIARAGDDRILDSEGDDSVEGGDGRDDFIYTTLRGDDTVVGGEVDDTAPTNSGDKLNFHEGTDGVNVVFTGDEAGNVTGTDGTIEFSEIEHILGGQGSDTIDASASSVEQILDGGEGSDTIQGGSGDDIIAMGMTQDFSATDGDDDVLVLVDGFGDDSIEGFETPTDLGGGNYSGNDQVDVSGLTDANGAPVNVNDVTVSDTNGDGTGDAILSFPNGESITLWGVAPSEVSSDAQLEAIGIPVPDYIVEGTAAGELIDASYVGDPEGDMVDNNDHSDGSNDDSILAGGGHDTIISGDGDDTVSGDGGNDSIESGAGNDLVYGGSSYDTIDAGIGDDTVYGGDGQDQVDLGDGHDTYFDGSGQSGTFGNDTVLGGAGDDTILATGGSDSLAGGAGDDSIEGGAENDTIDGGTGGDTIDAGDGDDIILLNDGFGNDVITGGATGEIAGDTLDLSGTTTGVTVDLTDANPETGSVTEGFDTAKFTEIENIILGGGRDTVTLADGGGADSVDAFDLTDSGDGTTNDQLDVSGLTSDGGTTPVTTADVVVTDTNGDGTGDAILTFPGGESITLVGVSPADVDSPAELAAIGIPGSPSNYIVEGTAAGEVIDGSYAGDPEGDMVDNNDHSDGSNDDSIEAGAGDDTIRAGLGDDTINAGDGADNIEGQAGNDSIDAGAGNDAAYGGLGNDTILGGAGNDTLYGSDGDDSLVGGLDEDDLNAGSGNDTLDGGVGNDFFDIDSGDGSSTVIGGAGDDTLFADADGSTDGFDITFTGDNAGNLSAVSGTGASAFSEIEAIHGSDQDDTVDASAGSTDVTILGGDGDDTITGGAGNDTIDGGTGDDSIQGGDGADYLTGGTGADTVSGGAGNDTIEGGNSVGTGGNTLHGDAGDDLIIGGDVGDLIYGGADDDTIHGNDGSDVIYAGAGDDSITGGAGIDFVGLESGNDTIQTGDDQDVISVTAAAYADGSVITVDGGSGGTDADTLDLGDFDAFRNLSQTTDADANSTSGSVEVLNASGNWVTVNFAEIETLTLPVTDLTPDFIVEGTAAGELINSAYTGDPEGDMVDNNDHSDGSNDDSILAGGGDDTVLAGSGDDTIDGGAGDDILYGQSGNDSVFGGAGNDNIDGGSGSDTLDGGDGSDMIHIDPGDGSNVVIGGETGETGTGDIINTNVATDAVVTMTGDEAGVFTAGTGSATFSEIEWIQTDEGNDSVDLTGDSSGMSVSTFQGDDTVTGGTGDDVVYLNAGDDVINLNDGFGNDTIVGGETVETDGDTLDLSGTTTGVTVDLTDADPETGTVSDGTDTAEFSQIENIVLGGGRDTVTLADGGGDDSVDAFDLTDSGDGTTNDQLDVSGLTSDGGTTPVNTDDVVVTDTNGDGTGDAILTFPGGESITLVGVSPADVDSTAELAAIGIPAPGGTATIYDAIELSGGAPTAGSTLTVAAGDLVEVDEPLVFSVDSVTNIAIGDTVTIDGTVYSVTHVNDLETNFTFDDGVSTDPVKAFHITLDDGSGGTLEYIIPHDPANPMADITEIEVTSVTAATDVDVQDVDDDNVVTLGTTLNYIVEGTDVSELIDASYVGDPEGDMVDNNDHSDGSNDDSILAGDGHDTVISGDGDDTVRGEGGHDSIESGAGNDLVYGGNSFDTIDAGIGDDTVYGGDGQDQVDLGDGADIFYEDSGQNSVFGNDTVVGGAGDDTIFADGGADSLAGGAGDDSIEGGLSNDTIDGGTGGDTIDAGDGDDIILLNDGFGNDVITGGATGETAGDTLDLSGTTTGVTVDLTDANPETGSVTEGFDTAKFTEIENIILGGGRDTVTLADGGGADSVDAFDLTDSGDGTTNDQLDVSGLTSDGGTTPVTTADVVVTDTNGDGTGDAILTFPGGESITLVGVSPTAVDSPAELVAIGIPDGRDFIVEGTAAGELINTAYVGDPEGDMIDNNDHSDGSNDDVIHAGGGDDTIVAGLGDDTSLGQDGADEIYSNDGDDSAEGGSGNDSIWGEDGNDTLHGGDDDDLVLGGAGADQVFGDAGDDSVYGAEGNDFVDGGTGNDTLAGEGDDDTLSGGDGDDQLSGGAGDDEVTGGSGDDDFLIYDSFGNDTLTGGEIGETDGDTLDLSGVTEDLRVVLASADPEAGAIQNGAGDNTTFTEIENIILGGGRDTVVLADGSGADTVNAFDLTDSGDGTTNDQLDVTGLTSDGGTTPVNTADVVVTDTNGDGTGDAILTFPGGESITLIGVAPTDVDTPAELIAIGIPDGRNFIVEGTAGGDTIDGSYTGDPEGDMVDNLDHSDGSNDDNIDAGAGDDSISGGLGSDTIQAGAGNDTVLAGDGDDTVYGGPGGSSGDDLIYGEGGNDLLDGDAGEDTIYGGVGNDAIYSATGNSELYGEDGNDSLYGGTGSTRFDGGAGDDVLQGGGLTDQDTLIGGTGDDDMTDDGGGDGLFIMEDDFGNDTIVGGETGESDGDTVDLSAVTQDTTVDLTDANAETGSISNGTDTANFTEIENIVLGGGRDTIVLADGSGDDTVQAFDMTDSGDGSTNDQLDVSNLTSDGGTTPVTVFDVVVTDTNGDGTGDAILSFPGGESITLVGVAPTDVDTPAELEAIGIPSVLDYIVEGSAGADTIDGGYLGDPEGDRVDNNDHSDGSNDDSIEGYGGDDSIDAGAGDDTVHGGDGGDTIDGGVGDDSLDGDDAPGSGGADSISGGVGNDTITGDEGNDTLLGGDGNDDIYGGDDDDLIRGGDGIDILYGEAGDDTLHGSSLDGDPDTIYGGDDRDYIYAGGDDVVDGGSGGDDFDVLDLSGTLTPGASRNIVVTGTDSNGNGMDGYVEYLDAGGAVLSTTTFTEIEQIVPCFTPGTEVATSRGLVLVQDLCIGDKVQTRDNGLQAIEWIGKRVMTAEELALTPQHRPVLIRKGSLGDGLPSRDMKVSPQHRMLIANSTTEMLFGEEEVLVPATHMTRLEGVDQVNLGDETYVHFMCSHHEVVFADSTWTESFQPGDTSLRGLDDASLEEIYHIFPELRDKVGQEKFQSARTSLKNTKQWCCSLNTSRLIAPENQRLQSI